MGQRDWQLHTAWEGRSISPDLPLSELCCWTAHRGGGGGGGGGGPPTPRSATNKLPTGQPDLGQ